MIEADGVDSGADSIWGKGSRAQSHPWHSMCSYLGAFPPQLARYFIEHLTLPGEIVLDPFSGRGTTHLEARVAGRTPVSSDLNPLAVALTAAKNAEVDLPVVLERIDHLEARFDLALYLPIAQSQSADVQLIFHPHTLARLCFLRRVLVGSDAPLDAFLVGVVLGIMHGAERSDGSSAYASLSMPNTFSMSPRYVRKYVQENGLKRLDRNVFDLLRDKSKRLLRQVARIGSGGSVALADARRLHDVPEYASLGGRTQLVLSSPPYLGVVNYAKQNWIRLWFLGDQGGNVTTELDDSLALGPWLEFMEEVLEGLLSFLTPDGSVVLVIGDVAKSKASVVSPARELMRRLHHDGLFSYIGAVSDYLNAEGKTTRIWKETRGNATRVDRVIVLANSIPRFMSSTGRESKLIDQMAVHAREFAGLGL